MDWFTPYPQTFDVSNQLTLREDIRTLYLATERQDRPDLPLPSVWLRDLADNSLWRVDFGPLINLTQVPYGPPGGDARSLAMTGGYSLYVYNGMMKWTPRIITLVGVLNPTLLPWLTVDTDEHLQYEEADSPLPSVYVRDADDGTVWRVDFAATISLTQLPESQVPQYILGGEIFSALDVTGGQAVLHSGLFSLTPLPSAAHVASPLEASWFTVNAQGVLDYVPLGYPQQEFYLALLDFKNGKDLYRFTLTTALNALSDIPVFDVSTPVDRVQADENVAVFFPRGILLPNGYTLYCEDGQFKVSNELPTYSLAPVHYNNVTPRLAVVDNQLQYNAPG